MIEIVITLQAVLLVVLAWFYMGLARKVEHLLKVQVLLRDAAIELLRLRSGEEKGTCEDARDADIT